MADAEVKEKIGIGLIGAGFMGKCHANAFRSVAGLFDLRVEPELRVLADVDEATARRSADALGFPRSTGDWRELTGDPEVGIVAITAPNALHAEIALAAIAAGKSVYCESRSRWTSRRRARCAMRRRRRRRARWSGSTTSRTPW